MKDAMKKKSSPSFFGIGLSSILIIFVLLCLMVFAMLSLVSARAGRRLEDRLFGRASAYYEACARADSLLERGAALFAGHARAVRRLLLSPLPASTG